VATLPLPAASLRADARRNREAILAAACDQFVEHGLEAPLCEIARRAGVGQGTLYRHFATREDLIAAIAEQQLAALEDLAGRTAHSPEAFLAIFSQAARPDQLKRDISQLIASLENRTLIGALRRRFRAIVTEPLHAAQAAGLVREDLTPDDVGILLSMVRAADERDSAAAERALGWVLDAMRPPCSPPV
jgi:AcrR family transcriptional regulator